MTYENQAAAETAGWEFYESNGDSGEWRAWRRVSRGGMSHGQHEEASFDSLEDLLVKVAAYDEFRASHGFTDS